MAYAESDNKQLPDTQEISTEEESESIYAESIFTSASWAKLIYIPNHKFSIGKYKFITIFEGYLDPGLI